jgi:hypothetical protein
MPSGYRAGRPAPSDGPLREFAVAAVARDLDSFWGAVLRDVEHNHSASALSGAQADVEQSWAEGHVLIHRGVLLSVGVDEHSAELEGVN